MDITRQEIEAERPEFVFNELGDIPSADENLFDTLMVQALTAHEEKRLMAVHPEAMLAIMNLIGDMRRADLGFSDDAADEHVDADIMAGLGFKLKSASVNTDAELLAQAGFSFSKSAALFKGPQPKGDGTPVAEPEVQRARRKRKAN